MTASSSDAYVVCFFDRCHVILAERYPRHLLKCAKNHPEKVRNFVQCDMNSTHLIPKSEKKMFAVPAKKS